MPAPPPAVAANSHVSNYECVMRKNQLTDQIRSRCRGRLAILTGGHLGCHASTSASTLASTLVEVCVPVSRGWVRAGRRRHQIAMQQQE
jgi:hypothetical protein